MAPEPAWLSAAPAADGRRHRAEEDDDQRSDGGAEEQRHGGLMQSPGSMARKLRERPTEGPRALGPRVRPVRDRRDASRDVEQPLAPRAAGRWPMPLAEEGPATERP